MTNEAYIQDIQKRLRNRGFNVSRHVMRVVLDVRYRNGRPKWEVLYRFSEQASNGTIANAQRETALGKIP